MKLNIAPESRKIGQKTLALIKGQARRLFMASVVKDLGRGGAAWVPRELGWDRTTVKKGLPELASGIVCVDHPQLRGRKGYAAKLPGLEADRKALCEAASQTDPTFRTTQMYRRLTAAEARHQLVAKGYREAELPAERSLCRMLGQLGCQPRRVAKTKPLRQIPQTNALFETVPLINAAAAAAAGTVRLASDPKTTVPIGHLSRGGKSRNGHEALAHDLEPAAKLTPLGMFRPAPAEPWLRFTTGHATADFRADRLAEIWPPLKKTVILHLPW